MRGNVRENEGYFQVKVIRGSSPDVWDEELRHMDFSNNASDVYLQCYRVNERRFIGVGKPFRLRRRSYHCQIFCGSVSCVEN